MIDIGDIALGKEAIGLGKAEKKYGFGVIGCGMVSRFHLEAIRDIDCAELIGRGCPEYGGAIRLHQLVYGLQATPGQG